MEPMDIVGKSKEDASLPKGFPLRSPLCVNLIEKLVCSYYIHIEVLWNQFVICTGEFCFSGDC